MPKERESRRLYALFIGTFSTLIVGQESSPWCGLPAEKKAGK